MDGCGSTLEAAGWSQFGCESEKFPAAAFECCAGDDLRRPYGTSVSIFANCFPHAKARADERCASGAVDRALLTQRAAMPAATLHRCGRG
jgi:hypothetical protein